MGVFSVFVSATVTCQDVQRGPVYYVGRYLSESLLMTHFTCRDTAFLLYSRFYLTLLYLLWFQISFFWHGLFYFIVLHIILLI